MFGMNNICNRLSKVATWSAMFIFYAISHNQPLTYLCVQQVLGVYVFFYVLYVGRGWMVLHKLQAKWLLTCTDSPSSIIIVVAHVHFPAFTDAHRRLSCRTYVNEHSMHSFFHLASSLSRSKEPKHGYISHLNIYPIVNTPSD